MKRNFFSGTARLRVTGLNLDRFLNNLLKSDIKIYDLVREEHKCMSFSVPYKTQKKIAEIGKDKPYGIACISSYGLPAVFAWARRRVVLLVSLAVAIAAVAMFNSFIWEVRISGLNKIEYSEVQNALADMGISGISAKSAVERGKLENGILARIPDVSYVNVYLKGVTLFVDIVEALPRETAESREPRDICAEADGVITRIVTISGTPLVRAGDKVTAGQILISREVIYPDGSSAEVRADGEIYAEVSYSAEAEFFGTEEDFASGIELLKNRALERAMAILPQGSCLIDTKYDIINTITGKAVRAVLLVERRIDS